MSEHNHTPGPWRWQGEDYRGDWGWQLLVGPSGEGIICGQESSGPYKRLHAFRPIDPKYCKTGFHETGDSAPAVHVREADARLIAAAPDLLNALKAAYAVLLSASADEVPRLAERLELARAAIAKAEGRA
jgi:hypothetical protein